ncbi:hypothetical protein MLD38_029531 [Melastoma candidum]|uniref:Uncharacterized protein n=1 Tax=Melastoma candidum TaxID=119954 RepID=A0ACB9N5P9_9MYRT|nr:hypothetical protein MLD38_029531 [Melastoma candidum]
MAKVPVVSSLPCFRTYGAVSGNVQAARSAVVRAAGSGSRTDEETSPTYWMRDPRTGNWAPETHFEAVDAVDLREKLLAPRKDKMTGRD